MAQHSLMNTYGRLPVSFERAQGLWMFDTDGNKYFDTFFGIAVCGLGHTHPKVSNAVKDQADRLMHCSNLYHTPLQQELAKKLCSLSGMESVFFSNSGAEANEAAIKIARKHGHDNGNDNPAIIVMDNSFHGRTMATLSATGNRKAQIGFEPLVSGFIRAPFNDIEAVKQIAADNDNVVAVMLELVQGEGGIHIGDKQYLADLQTFCKEKDWLLIADEVQTGNGRTGNYFATETFGVDADVITTAKGLGNGYPIGACMAKGKASKVLVPGTHGSTYGGNPLGCAAALATIKEIVDEGLSERAKVLGDRIVAHIQDELGHVDYIKDIRGQGLMIGIEMSEPCTELVAIAKTKGILLNVTAEKVIRLLPALNMSDEECAFLCDSIVQLIRLYAADDRAKPRT